MARHGNEPPEEDGQAYGPGEPLTPAEQAAWRDRLRNGYAIFMPDHKLRWWEDGDKMGSIVATLVILGIALVFLAICVRLVVLIWP